MEWLFKKAEEFLRRHKFIRRWRKVLAVMMAMVVFMSTYAMVLPAITLETGEGAEIGLFADSSGDESVPDGSTVTDSIPEAGAEGAALTTETAVIEDTAPAETAPVENVSTENAPAENTPAEPEAAETAPTEAAPTEAVPTEATPTATETPAPQVEEVPATPEEPKYLDNEKLVFENNSIKLTLTVPAAAKVVKGASLDVREIGQPFANDGLDENGRKNEYLSYLAAAETALNLTAEEITYIEKNIVNTPAAELPWARFFAISIKNADGAIAPACALPVEIIYKNTAETAADGLKVMCLLPNGTMTMIGSETKVATAAQTPIALLSAADSNFDITSKFVDAGTLTFGTFAVQISEIDAAIEKEKEEAAKAAAEAAKAESATAAESATESAPAESSAAPAAESSVAEATESSAAETAESSATESVPAEDASVSESAESGESLPEDASEAESAEESVAAETESAAEEAEKTEEGTETQEQPKADDKVTKTLVTKGADYTVTMTYTADAKIPAGAVLSAKEILPTAYNYKGYFNKATDALNLSDKEKDKTYARFFDIKILLGTSEVTPAVPVQVEITYNKPQEKSANAEMNAVHFGKEGTEVIAAEATQADAATGEVNAVGFEAGSFSVYGVMYTVDFETVDGGTYSIPGGGCYKLSDLLPFITGEEGAISKVNLKLIEGEDVEGALYPTQNENGEWYINSNVAFASVYLLEVTVGDVKYQIKVTDAAESSNLVNFLTKVDINAETDSQGRYVVRKGKPITIDLSFKETPNLQLDLNTMTYPIPAGLDAVEGIKGNLTIHSKDGAETYDITGNEYEVKDGVLILKWNKDDPNFSHLAAASNTEFKIHISAALDGSSSSIDFGGGISKTFDVQDPHGVTVQKSNVKIDKVTGEVEYLVTVTSTGDNTNIVVTDSSSQGKALSHVPNTIKVYNNRYDWRDATLVNDVTVNQDNASGFNLTIPSMKDGETYAITYKGQVDVSNLTKNSDGSYGIDSDTLNSVTAKPEGWPSDSTTHTQGTIYAKPEVKKSAGTASDVVDGKRTIAWTMTATSVNTPDGGSSLAGGWIKDTIDNSTIPGTNKTSQDLMKYSGSGINIVITDENGKVVGTRHVKWEDMGVNPATATSWTYNVPNTGVDKTTNGKLTYTITYTTDVDVSETISEITVKNGGDSNKGEPTTGTGKAGPIGENEAGVEKKVTATSLTEVSWEVAITVPATGLTVAQLEDIYPASYNNQVDSLKAGSISYIDFLPNETHTEDTSDPTKMIINFGYMDANNVQHSGLVGTGEQRVVKVKFTTTNNTDWIADTINGPGTPFHVNTVNFTGNQKVFTDTATAVPTIEQKVVKSVKNNGLPTGTVTVNGAEMPVWTYEIVITGLLSDSEITDTFDDRLVFVPFDIVVDNPADRTQPGILYGGNNVYGIEYYVGKGGGANPGSIRDAYVDATPGENSVVFHIGEANIPKYAWDTDHENTYFKITYQLRAKDEASLESLMAAAEAESDYTYKNLKNTATFGPSESTINSKYEFKPITKELINSGEIGGLNNVGKFRIVINPSGLDLDPDSDYLTVSDTIVQNLSIVYSTIAASPSEGVKWIFSNNRAEFTVPDATPVTITYDAVIADPNIEDPTKPSDVHFINEAEWNGHKSIIDETKKVQTKAEGISSNPEISVLKHKNGDMTTTVEGAVFGLYYYDGPWADENGDFSNTVFQENTSLWKKVVDKNGNHVTRTTGADGVGTFRGNQQTDGWTITEKTVLYALHEEQAPPGYQSVDTYFRFVISDEGIHDYNKFIYYNGDTMRAGNTPTPGIIIEKDVMGIELTEAQKQAITFEITDPDNNKTTLTFDEFTKGAYKISGEAFKEGTYTITEITTPPEGYELNTSVATGNTQGTVTKDSTTGQITATSEVTVTSTNESYTVSFLNKYSSASINVVKIGESAEYLEGAVFELFRIDSETGEEISYGTKTSTGDAAGFSYVGLEDGSYILKEISPPEGYLKTAGDMTFTVTEGVVHWNGEATNSGAVSYKPSTKTVTVVNRKDTQVRVNKVWAGEPDKSTPVVMKLYRSSIPFTFKTVPYKDNNQTFGDVTFPVGATVKAYFTKENGEPGTQEFVTDAGTPQIHIGQNNISNVRFEIILPANIENSKRLVETKSTVNNTALFEGLDRTDPAGNLYTYWVEEETPTGRYTVRYEGNYVSHNSASNVITVTNTPEEEEDGLIEVEKVWKDASGQTISDTRELPEISLKLKAVAPSGDAVIHCLQNGQSDKFTITTYGNGSKIQLGDTITLNYGSNKGSVTKVCKGSVNGLEINATKDDSNGKVTFKVSAEDIYVIFGWLNATEGTADKVSGGSSGPAPDDVTITLNNTNQYYWNSEAHPEVTLDTENYAYTVVEESIPQGYAVSYSTNNTAGIMKGKLTVTNTALPNEKDISFSKEWVDSNNAAISWPQKNEADVPITITITRKLEYGEDGNKQYGPEEAVGTLVLTSTGATSNSTDKTLVVDESNKLYTFTLKGLEERGSIEVGEEGNKQNVTGNYVYYFGESELDAYNTFYYAKDSTDASGWKELHGTSTSEDGKIRNTVISVELPETGGPGTLIYSMLGMMLIAFAGTAYMILLLRRRASLKGGDNLR